MKVDTVDGRATDQRDDLVSANECAAMSLLDAEWTRKELAMVFQVARSTVAYHVDGDCTHPQQ